jgi:hypothetical protein
MDRWLGAWSLVKVEFLLELVDRASVVAPAYVGALVTAGQRYAFSRGPVGASAQDDAVEERWHLIAVGVLQQRLMGAQVVGYVDALHARRPLPANAAVWDPRILLARGIGQEQVCRMMHATARNDRLLSEFEGKAATPPAVRQMAIECMQAAQRYLEIAAAREEVRDEARTRAGFAAFSARQERRCARSARRCEWRSRSDSRLLARALPGPRVRCARRRCRCRACLWRSGPAVSRCADCADRPCAGTLPLHRTMTPAEAMLAARRVRADGVDPWETYFDGDARFVAGWFAAMRKARK